MGDYGHDEFPESPLNKGRRVLLMTTVAHWWTGHVTSVGAREVVLADAVMLANIPTFINEVIAEHGGHAALLSARVSLFAVKYPDVSIPCGVISISRGIIGAVLGLDGDRAT